MKVFILILRLFLASSLVWFAVSLLYPHYLFKIEKIEYFIVGFMKINWLVAPFLARIFVGLFFSVSILILLYKKHNIWLSFLALVLLFLPFLINPILSKDFEYRHIKGDVEYNTDLLEFIENDGEVLLAFFSANCLYCYNAAKKLYVAKETSKHFPEVKVVGVSEEIKKLFSKTNTKFEYVLISKEEFLMLTNYQYPKVHYVRNGKIERIYDGYSLNYKVLSDFSKKH